MIYAPNLSELDWVVHGFGLRDSWYPKGIRLVKQIHSATVIFASGGSEPPCEGDAVVSDTPGVTAGVKTADCVPILLADTGWRAVASIHAGWRGTAAAIVKAALKAMSEKYGSRPELVRAAIGPAIGACCYEVGPEVACQFGIEGAGPAQIDLASINEAQLREAGVTDIWKSGECTYCRADRFFSYRREKEQAGRQISFIGIL